MRRGFVVGLLLVGAVAFAVLLGGGGSPRARVAVIFDSAKGMVPGQQVKIAGAVVGSVASVGLAPGPKARMVLNVDRRFTPFHADASCSIRPEGLISEDFVECDPGRSPRPLAAGPGGTPQVPLTQTTVPVSLQDVLNVFSLPTDERVRAIITELGIATAGRGEDINALLRRANPALQQSRRVLAIVGAQRAQLTDGVVQSDRILAELGAHERGVRAFVDRAARVAGITAQHRGALGAAIRDLPPMLDAARPGLRTLDRTARTATPFVRSLHAAAPGLARVTTTIPAFARAGTPAVRALGGAAATGRTTLRSLIPLAARLRTTSVSLRRLAGLLAPGLASTRDTGGFEGILRVAYAFAVNTALYDNVSHFITFIARVAPGCLAGQQSGTEITGCNHNYNSLQGGMLPINEPSCGPVDPAWFDKHCPEVSPGPIATGLPRRHHAKKPRHHRARHRHPAVKLPTRPVVHAPHVKVPRLPAPVDQVLHKLLGHTVPHLLDVQRTNALLDYLLR